MSENAKLRLSSFPLLERLAAVEARAEKAERERDEATKAERAKIVEYLKRRGEWLKRERKNGGHRDLAVYADEDEVLAGMIAKGRHEDPHHIGDPEEASRG